LNVFSDKIERIHEILHFFTSYLEGWKRINFITPWSHPLSRAVARSSP
jgi:hypothetical protein